MKVHPLFVSILTVIKIASLICQAENNNSENYLIHQILMKNYNPLVRPVANSSHSVDLNLTMGLKGLIELDMKKQTLVSFGWLTVRWYDHFLRWDRNQYPFQKVHLKQNMVWRPDIVIFNSVSDIDQLEDQKRNVIVEHTGKVTWYPGGVLQTFCSIRIFNYPLDTQTCSVDVVPWSYTKDDLNAFLMDPVFDDYVTMQNHPEWTMVSKTAGYTLWPSDYWVVQFTFTLKRNVMFYIFNMILPIVLLSLMNSLVFLLPADSGEKMTVSVTMFLSFAVFLSVINNSLPPNSDSVCLFSVFVSVQMCLSVISIIMAACIVFIANNDKDSYTALREQSQSPNSSEERKPFGVISTPYTLPEAGQGSMTDTAINRLISSPIVSGNTEPAQSSTAPGNTFTVARNEKREDSLSAAEASASLPTERVVSMVMGFHHLKPIERRLVSQQLDNMCLKLTIGINIIICLIFCLIWKCA